MASFLSNLLSSTGLKRRIVAWLNTILGLVYASPALTASLGSDLPAVNAAIAALGGVAVTHAVVQGTATRYVLLTAASVLAFIIGLAGFVPALIHYVPALMRISAVISALAAGTTLVGSSDSNPSTSTSK